MSPKKLPLDKLYLYSARDQVALSRDEEDRLRRLEGQYLQSYDAERAKLESKLQAINEAMAEEEKEGEEEGGGKGKAQEETLLRRIFGGVLGQMEEGEGEREVRVEEGFEIEDDEYEDLGDVGRGGGATEATTSISPEDTPGPESESHFDPGEGSSGLAGSAGSGETNHLAESDSEDEYVRQQRENRRLLAERQAREAERAEAGETETQTAKQKIVGKKKGKSLARKEQKKAYHEYTRMVSDARKREEQEWMEEYKEVLALQKWVRIQKEARASFELMVDRLYESFLAELEVQSRHIWLAHQQSQLEVSDGGYLYLPEGGDEIDQGGENVVTADGRFWVTLTPHERQVVLEFIRDKGRVELDELAELVRELKTRE
ncbi:Hypothetical protein conserved in the Yarrowia clade [Yarrowia lipolytica]|nr:Hypothetical protein conserved in the Yarrowia clade [Yarrowia lipolytica]